MTTVYEMALNYYPRLWDKSRLEALVEAGRLTAEEAEEIIGGAGLAPKAATSSETGG